eukprot:1197847-Pleurochrysis_carterae.AAC.1
MREELSNRAAEFAPPPPTDWDQLAALPFAKFRLSEVWLADIRHLTHIFTTREWQCRNIISALDEAGIIVDVLEQDFSHAYRLMGWLKGLVDDIEKDYWNVDKIIGLIIAANLSHRQASGSVLAVVHESMIIRYNNVCLSLGSALP